MEGTEALRERQEEREKKDLFAHQTWGIKDGNTNTNPKDILEKRNNCDEKYARSTKDRI